MNRKYFIRSISRVDVQVSIFTAVVVILSCLTIFAFFYSCTYNDMIDSLEKRTQSIHSFIDKNLTKQIFEEINTPEDMNTKLYKDCQELLYQTKQAAGVEYLYTAKQTADGSFIYVVDGLSLSAPDFRRPGDMIEHEIVPELNRALSGEIVLPDEIKDTDWGKIFITYVPIHDGNRVMGVMGIEFEAEQHYDTYRLVRLVTPLIALFACLISALFAMAFFMRISNPAYRDLANSDYLTQLKNRNAFETDLQNFRAKKLRDSFVIFVLDLNNLKKVNDMLGHEYGDIYLKSLAKAMRMELPDSVIPYRVGGDEFVLIAMRERPECILSFCEKITDRLEKEKPENWKFQLSFAVGYAEFEPDKDNDLFDTYSRADQAMYREKKAFHQKFE